MESITKSQILESIGKVYDKAKDCAMKDTYFEEVATDLELLSQYFKTSKNQAFFISVVFALNMMDSNVDMHNLVKYVDCNPMKILQYSDDFEYLYKRGIFKKQKSYRRVKVITKNEQFYIAENVIDAILQNKPVPEVEVRNIETIVDVLELLYNLGKQRSEEDLSTLELFEDIEKTLETYADFPLIRMVKQMDLDTEDAYLFLYLTWKTITGDPYVDLGKAMSGIYDRQSKIVAETQRVLTGEYILIKNELVVVEPANFFNDTEIKLTDKAHNILQECEIKLFGKKAKLDNIIEHESIVENKLIFDLEEMKQIDTLQNLLQDDNFKEVRARLTQKGLSQGVAVLLHGAPGTGKTEIVKQLAKTTQRKILKVEISNTKSKWFGDSEKNIKRIFTNYKEYAKNCAQVPILFFNEADAIFAQRKNSSSSNVAQTENAIQNILLEELENFEGILMATTNLMDNLDAAFERRFLFKILFAKPNAAIRAQIWKLKMPNLSMENCNKLGQQFEFSGGQIDNIIRKSEIDEIIKGTSVSYERITNYCFEETVSHKKTGIGFGVQPS